MRPPAPRPPSRPNVVRLPDPAPLCAPAACAPARPASSGSTTSSCAASASGSRPTSSVSARCAHAPDCDARGWGCGRAPMAQPAGSASGAGRGGARRGAARRGGGRRHSPRRGAAASRDKTAGGGRTLGRQGVGGSGREKLAYPMLSLRPFVTSTGNVCCAGGAGSGWRRCGGLHERARLQSGGRIRC